MPWLEVDQIPFTFEYPDNFWVKKISNKRLPALSFVREDVEYWPMYLHLTWETTNLKRVIIPPGWKIIRSGRIQTPSGETKYVVGKQMSYRLFLFLSILFAVLAFIINIGSILILSLAISFLIIALVIYFMARKILTAAFNYAGVEYVFTFYNSSIEDVVALLEKVTINP